MEALDDIASLEAFSITTTRNTRPLSSPSPSNDDMADWACLARHGCWLRERTCDRPTRFRPPQLGVLVSAFHRHPNP